VRQAQDVPGDSAGALHRALNQFMTMILTETGDLAGAEQACAAGLAWCRDVGDLTNLSGQLWNKVILDLRASRVDDAMAHLRELLQIAMQTGLRPVVLIGLDCCGHLCAATRRPAEAITAWAAASALGGPWPLPYGFRNLVVTTTFHGDLYALDAGTGKILLKTPLSAGSNAPVAIDGDYVIAGAGASLVPSQQRMIIAYKLGATGKLPDTVGP